MSKKNSKRAVGMKRFFRIFFSRGWVTKLCFGIITAFVFIAVFAPVLTRYTPYEQNLRYILAGPSGEHLLGCDNIGRDTLTRLLYGARVSLITGLLSSIWAAILGTSIGLIAGYVGGWLNTLVMRITDAMIAIPPIIFTMVLSAMVTGNLIGFCVFIGVSIIPSYIRMVNGLVISLGKMITLQLPI